MENVGKLESMVASWYKDAPHLPLAGQKWLGCNAWWLTLVGVIFGTLGVLGLIMGTFFVGLFLGAFGGTAGAAIGGTLFIAVLFGLAFSVVEVLISAMAITPLKLMQKRGWRLLFIVLLVHVLQLAVTFLFYLNPFGLIMGLLGVAVGAYFLFEIRSFYGDTHTARKTASSPAAKKPSTK